MCNPKPPPPTRRPAFTLVELLVVIAVIGLLIGLLLPAVQAAREAARRMQCANHLKQIALATHNFQDTLGHYPPSFGGIEGGNWSAQARLLPFLEERAIHDEIDFAAGYENARLPDGSPLGALRVKTYLCPSETADRARWSDGVAIHYPLNYGVNVGVWLVFDPATRRGGAGAFHPHSKLRPADFVDGLSSTLLAAEVKAYTPYFRNAALDQPDMPSEPTQLCAFGGEFKSESGHTEWIDGRSHQTGFTTAFAPNARVECVQSGRAYDLDWTNQQEGKSNTVATYAAVTARSAHPGVVNAAGMDGSVRTWSETVDLSVWRAASTRNGREILAPGP